MKSYQCVILAYLQYGDNDLIIHCYSQEQGYISFFGYGANSKRSKIRAFLYPLNRLLISIQPSSYNKELKTIKNIELIKNPLQTQQELKNHTLSFLIADFLNQILSKESYQESYFQEIELLIQQTEQNNSTAFITFFLRILFHLGYLPELQDQQYLDLETGCFQDIESPTTCSWALSKHWRELIVSQLDYQYQVPKNDRMQFTDSIFQYYQNHYPNFRVPKSYSVLKDILHS